MTRKATSDRMKRARDELCAVLGYGDDPEALTVDQNMRVDLVLALKVALDDMRAALFRGEAIDHGKMMSIAESIERYLPAETKPDPTPALYRKDPRQAMEEILDRWLAADEEGRRERGLPEDPKDARIVELESELAALRAMLPDAGATAALTAPEQRVIDPPTGDIVGPREQSDRAENMRSPVGTPPKAPVTIDAQGNPLRPGAQIVDGKIVPIPPTAKSGAETKAAMDRVNADRGFVHKVMTERSRVAHEPTPSTGPRIVEGGGGIIWGGRLGRSW